MPTPTAAAFANSGSFLGGMFSGLVAAILGIVNNAPGTAAPIPGLLAPFAFNPPLRVALAMGLAAVGGIAAGYICSWIFKKLKFEVTTKVGE